MTTYECTLSLVVGLLLFPILAVTQSNVYQVESPAFRFKVSKQESNTSVIICNLELGKQYDIQVFKAKEPSCQIQLTNSITQESSFSRISYRAKRNCLELSLSIPCMINEQDDIWLTGNCNDCQGSPKNFPNGVEITPYNGTAENLVKQYFLGSDCFSISNITLHGNPNQVGIFTNDADFMDIEEGVLFSTGDVQGALGPNMSSSTTTDFDTTTFDADLTALGDAVDMHDVVILEFDFEPTIDTIQFEYVFASEEYCEFADDIFNDVFGFFISGAGINGPFENNAENLARLPNDELVSINNVNSNTNSEYYVNNTPPTRFEACSNGAPALASELIEYDGYTKVLTAKIGVIQCETYHLKIIIGDRSDGSWDSGIFLKARSFLGGPKISASSTSTIFGMANEDVFEGCEDAFFFFERVGDNLTDTLAMPIHVSNTSTATEGVDFGVLPDTVYFLPGETTASLLVDIFPDNIPEGQEFILLDIPNPCNCSARTATLFWDDKPPFDISLPDVTACQGETISFGPLINNGVPGFTYSWSNGNQDSLINIQINGPEAIRLDMEDVCGQQAFAEINITPTNPTVALTGGGNLCDGNPSVDLNFELTGNGPWNLTYTRDGIPEIITDIQENSFSIPVSQAGTYRITDLNTSVCVGEADGEVTITAEELAFNAIVNPVTCFGFDDGSIQVQMTNGTGPFDYNWRGGLNNQSTQDFLEPGSYGLVITDATGCRRTTSFEITEPDSISISVVSIQDIDCSNIGQGSIDIDVIGGVTPYTYQWTNGSREQDPSELDGGTYNLIVQDSTGCFKTASVDVAEDLTAPDLSIQALDTLTCATTTARVQGMALNPNLNLSFEWSTENGSLVGITDQSIATVDQIGTYKLKIVNTDNSCPDSAWVEVVQDIQEPIAEAGEADTLTCFERQLTLNGNGTSTGNRFQYTWNVIGGQIDAGQNSLNPQISLPGKYYLEVLDRQNGCTSIDSVLIELDQVAPVIAFAPAELISCRQPTITIINTSPISPDWEFNWQSSNGEILSDPSLDSIIVGQGGQYSLNIVDTHNGCSVSESIEIFTNLVEPIVSAGPDEILNCNQPLSNLQGSINIPLNEVDFQWNTLEGNFTLNQTSLSPEVAEDGVFELLVTNINNGCQSTDTVTIETNFALPNVSIAPINVLTCSQPELTIQSTNANPNAPISYSWNTSDGQILSGEDSPQITTRTPGNYTLITIHTESFCQDTSSVLVEQNSVPPVIDILQPAVLDCNNQTLNIDATRSSTGSNFQINWQTSNGNFVQGSNSLSPEINAPGSYVLEITNTQNGCQSSNTVEVLQDITAPIINIGSDIELNCGLPNYTIPTTVSLPNDQVDFQWNTLEGNVILNQTSLTPNVSAAGIFELQLSNINNGCESRDTVQLTVNFDTPEIAIPTPDNLDCENDQQVLESINQISGMPLIYNWNTLDGQIISNQNTSQITASLPGTYTLITINTDNQCRDTISVLLGQDVIPPILTIQQATIIDCNNRSIVLDASNSSNGDNFLLDWQTTDGRFVSDQNTLTPTVDLIGTYTLNITNRENGCVSSQSVDVFENFETPVVEAGLTRVLSCTESELSLDGSQSTFGANSSINWFSSGGAILQGENTLTPTIDKPGIYLLRITNDDNGCFAIDSVEIQIDTLAPLAIAGPDLTLDCANNSYIIDGTNSNAGANTTIVWSSTSGTSIQNSTTLNPRVSEPGEYVLTISNQTNGCISEDSILVSLDTIAPIITLPQTGQLTCTNPSLQIEAEATGSGSFDFQWSTTNGQIEGVVNTASLSTITQGSYSLSVVDLQNSCMNTASINISIDTIAPVADAGPDRTISCLNPEVTIDGSQSSTLNVDYQWENELGELIPNATSNQLIAATGGIYILRVLNNLNGCEQTDEVTVIEDKKIPQASATSPLPLNCLRTTTLLQGNITPNGPINMQWQNQAGQVLSMTEQFETNLAGDYTFIVRNPENGCESVSIVTVLQDTIAPVVDAGPALQLDCQIGEILLTGMATSQNTNLIFNWSTVEGKITTGNNTLNPLVNSEGIYVLEAIDQQNGCVSQDSTLVSSNAPSTVQYQINAGACQGDLSTIRVNEVQGGTAPYVYSIDGGNSFSTQTNFINLNPGSYNFMVQDINGCSYEEQLEIATPLELEIALPEEEIINLGDSFQLNPQINLLDSAISQIKWFPADGLSCSDCLNPTVTTFESSVYTLQLTSTNGCSISERIKVLVDKNVPVFIPNAFSPYNNDGNNDLFMLYSSVGIQIVKTLYIFDRWGTTVFQQKDFQPNDPQFGWDGTKNGTRLNAGVFVYVAEVELVDGRMVTLKGDITLID